MTPSVGVQSVSLDSCACSQVEGSFPEPTSALSIAANRLFVTPNDLVTATVVHH